MGGPQPATLFVLGNDYHLGDLLWLTAVIAEYRRQRQPMSVAVASPDRPVNRILRLSPTVDDVIFTKDAKLLLRAWRRDGERVVHDLRPRALAISMLKQCRYRLPWLYYKDLWMEPRGQWLATYLRLGRLNDFRPILEVGPREGGPAGSLPRPYVLLAPHIGHYKSALSRAFWGRIKVWDWDAWIELARRLRAAGIEPVSLASEEQTSIPGTTAMIGLPIEQAAAAIESASALVSGESGLWFIAAALETPFVIVPWWLPRSVDWPGPMKVPHRLVYRREASVGNVMAALIGLGVSTEAAPDASKPPTTKISS